jgi:hypothetical protein
MALPPSAYQQWKAAAPEVAVIEVLSSARESTVTESQGTAMQMRRTNIVVNAEARVISVEKSGGGLAAGATIHLRYTHVPLRQQRMENRAWVEISMVGATPIPILEKGDKVTAWLRPAAEGMYEPAAESESFTVIAAPPAPVTKTD